MGRAFERRKERKFKRWGDMSRTFTRLGKQITMAVKEGGPDPETNPHLRILIETANKKNMPKDNIKRAIKRVTDKDYSDYKEVNYEGFAPHGVAIFIETATDNNTRTVANIRSYFTKVGGSLGTSGSVEFLFEHKVIFHAVPLEGTEYDPEMLALELIDYDVDEFEIEDGEIVLAAPFTSNGAIQNYMESNGFKISNAEFVRLPQTTVEVTPEQREEINRLLEMLEEDDDVQEVFHNMEEETEEE